jgi:hypothetical protein
MNSKRIGETQKTYATPRSVPTGWSKLAGERPRLSLEQKLRLVVYRYRAKEKRRKQKETACSKRLHKARPARAHGAPASVPGQSSSTVPQPVAPRPPSSRPIVLRLPRSTTAPGLTRGHRADSAFRRVRNSGSNAKLTALFYEQTSL